MRKSLWSIGHLEPENNEAGKNPNLRRPPVRIPGHLPSLSTASHSKAGLGGTVRREPMRIEKTPQGRRFVRRNIINEIGSRTGGELPGAVAKKFAQKDSTVQNTQKQRSAQTSVMTMPTPQSSMHTRNGAASTVAVVSAAAQAEVAAFPPWAWGPPPRVEAPRTPILLTGKKPSAETIRVADAFIARSQRALDMDAPTLGTSGKSASSSVTSTSQSTNGNEGNVNIPTIQRSNLNVDNSSSRAVFSNRKGVAEALNTGATTNPDPSSGIDFAPNFIHQSPKEVQAMPVTVESLRRAAGIDDATRPTKSSPMLDTMRKSLASVVDSPRRPRLQRTEVSGIVTHLSSAALPYAHATKDINVRNNKTPPSQPTHNVSMFNCTSKPDSPAHVFTIPTHGSEYLIPEFKSLPVQSENSDQSQHVASPAQGVLMAEFHSLVAEIRACHEEHIRREEQQVQRMARLEHLTAQIVKKHGLPATGQQPMTLDAVALPTARLHFESTTDVVSSKVSCDGKELTVSEMLVQGKDGLPGKKGGLEQSSDFMVDDSPCVQVVLKPVTPEQNPRAPTEARHSSRIQDRRLRLGTTTPAWLIGRSKKTEDAVTKNSRSSVQERESRSKTPASVAARGTRAKSEAPFNSAKASKVKTHTPVVTRGMRAKSEAPFNSAKASKVKTQTPVIARGTRAKTEAPFDSGKANQAKTPTSVVSRRSNRAKSESPSVTRRGRPRLSVSRAPVGSGRGSYRRSQSPTSGGSGRGRRKRSQSPTPGGSRRGRPRRSVSRAPVSSGRGRPRRSVSRAPVSSRRGRPRRSVSRAPVSTGRGPYRRSQSPTPIGYRRRRPSRSQSPTPVGSRRRKLSRSQSPTPVGSGKGRHKRSQSPTPVGSGRGQPRRSVSRAGVGSGRGPYRRSQSPTPGFYRRKKPSRSQSPTPVGSGRRRSSRSQSPTPVGSGRRRSSRSQSPTSVGSGRRKPSRSQSPTSVGSGRRKPSRSQSPTPMGSGKGRPNCFQFISPAVSKREQSKDSKTALHSSSPDQIKIGSKRLAIEGDISSAKRACVSNTFLEWEASNPGMSSEPHNAMATLDKPWGIDSPLATPLDVTVVDGTTDNTMAIQSRLKNTSLPDKNVHNETCIVHESLKPEHVEETAAHPCLIVPSKQSPATVEHSYSRSPWTPRSLVADYHSFTKSPSPVSEKSNAHTNTSRVIHITKIYANSGSKAEPTSKEGIESLKTTETPKVDEKSPKLMKTFNQACSESPKEPGSINPSVSESSAVNDSQEIPPKSPISLAIDHQNPFVSLERIIGAYSQSKSPDFSQTLGEFWSPAKIPKRPTQEELDLLMNSPLYTYMSSAATSPSHRRAPAKSTQTPSTATQTSKLRMWRPSDLVKGRSTENVSKSVAKNPFKSSFKSLAETPGSLLPMRVASAKKSDTIGSTKKTTSRKSLIKYQMLRKSFPKLMMTPVNTPVSRSRINARPLDSATKTSRNVQAMLELLEDA